MSRRQESLAALIRDGLTAEAAGAGAPLSLLEWALRVPEPKTGRLDFARFPFQRELYELTADDHEVVIKKAAQVGVSAFLVRWTMYWADRHGLTGLYVFPKARQLGDFSDARIRPLIQGSEYLRERVPADAVQNKMLKQIGRGLVYFRGSESIDDLDAIDADVLAFDEYDTLKQENIPDAERRVAASSHGLIRRVGVPSVPGFGISLAYEQSDQRVWMVRCDACPTWQPIDFWKNVDQTALEVVCHACRKPLDVTHGEWVATYPERTVKGYTLSRLLVPGTRLERLVAASNERDRYKRQVFYNKDLGEDYASDDDRLSLATLQAAQREYTTEQVYCGDNPVTAGIDVASTRALHVRISEHFRDGTKRALFLGEVDSFEELAPLMDRYRVMLAVIDHQPDQRLARRFAEQFPGRVYLVSYSTRQADLLVVDEEQRRVSVRRTEVLDATLDEIRRQQNHLPLDLPTGYFDHLQALVRFVEHDEFGRLAVGYRSSGRDDFAHAEAYDSVAGALLDMRLLVEEASRPDYFELDIDQSRVNDYSDLGYSHGPSGSDHLVVDPRTGHTISLNDLIREYTPWAQ